MAAALILLTPHEPGRPLVPALVSYPHLPRSRAAQPSRSRPVTPRTTAPNPLLLQRLTRVAWRAYWPALRFWTIMGFTTIIGYEGDKAPGEGKQARLMLERLL